MTERTLSIIKPDAVSKGLAGRILGEIEQSGLRIVALRMLRLDRRQAEGFYAVHQERPFFRDLVEFMCSGPAIVAVLEGEKAIERYRALMGATDPAKADEGTLRKKYAANVQNNAVHGSDGPDTARSEVAYFFSAVDIVA
ncbi:MAG: nucleoside-diphosphate kinase [Deltaproteobacteria bacterium]|nr:nucleoside-diphosphate kinase [Deltaproteobacteria bacterium]